jgi:hypothetical protein
MNQPQGNPQETRGGPTRPRSVNLDSDHHSEIPDVTKGIFGNATQGWVI